MYSKPNVHIHNKYHIMFHTVVTLCRHSAHKAACMKNFNVNFKDVKKIEFMEKMVKR